MVTGKDYKAGTDIHGISYASAHVDVNKDTVEDFLWWEPNYTDIGTARRWLDDGFGNPFVAGYTRLMSLSPSPDSKK